MGDGLAPVAEPGAIPDDDLRISVWTRDQGRCRQFDHVIPWGRGGAISEENLQLVCRSCNPR
jgi:hypothetical protein